MLRVKIRVNDKPIPSENKSYPGGAVDALTRGGANRFNIGYTDGMPICCNVSDELYAELEKVEWIESIETIARVS